MSKLTSALLNIAAGIIPALGALAKADPSGKLADDIVDVIKSVAKSDDASKVKTLVEQDPAVQAELEKQLAELALRKQEEENKALEAQNRLELEKAQKSLEDRQQQHEQELELAEKHLANTEAARRHALEAAKSERWWVSGINPLLSIIITFAFLGFIYLIATIPLNEPAPNGNQPSNANSAESAATGQNGGERQPADAEVANPAATDPATSREADADKPATPDGKTASDGKTTPDGKTTDKARVDNRDVFYVAFGALATAFATVIGFHFGSSSGSKRKTQLQRIYGVGARAAPAGSADAAPAQTVAAGNVAGGETASGAASHPFEAFWLKNLSHIEHFNWKELLFKGASHARFKSNTDPDPSLYPNVVPLVNLLEKIRQEVGAPVRLLSIYRSPDYNRDVGGAASSRHMQFDAADFEVLGAGAGNSDRWYKIAKRLRDKGEFKGGIGVYKTFVHVDTRGTNTFWDSR